MPAFSAEGRPEPGVCPACGHRPGDLKGRLRCDILLFVATGTEKEKLRQAARSLGLGFEKRVGTWFTYYDLGQVGSYSRIMAVQTEMGPFSHDGSAARALMAKTETSATAMISLGMAFGVDRSRQKIGDIVISTILLPYDDRRVYTDAGTMRTDYGKVKAYAAKPSLVMVLRRMATASAWRKKVSFGAVLTGGARIHCAQYRDELVRELSNRGAQVIGGEMEGAGLLSASQQDDPAWIVVKGICDFADDHRDAEIKQGRKVACANAAAFALAALRDFNPEDDDKN